MQLARRGTTCCMIPHLQIEKELKSGELIDLTPGLFQRRMLYWHRFAPESRMMRRVTDALIDYGHKVLRRGLNGGHKKSHFTEVAFFVAAAY